MGAIFDIRYHWLTLVALFFALGLGLLVGTAVGEGQLLSRGQQRLTESLQASLDKLRDENRGLREENARLAAQVSALGETMEMLVEAAVRDRLRGMEVELHLPPGMPPEVERRWRALLAVAGATLVEPAAAEATVEAETTQGDLVRERVAVFVNPRGYVPIREGRRGVVVWEPGSFPDYDLILPSNWLTIRWGQPAASEWVLIEALYRGRQGHVRVPARLSDALPVLNRWLTDGTTVGADAR